MTDHEGLVKDWTDFVGEYPQSSYSGLTLHRKCPRAWYYRYGLRLEQMADSPSPYLTIGSWWSVLQAVESAERGLKLGSLIFPPKRLKSEEQGYNLSPKDGDGVTEVIRQASRRWNQMTDESREEFEAALGATLPNRLAHMFEIWDEANAERAELERPLGVEVFWKRKLPRPTNDSAWSILADPESVPQMHLIGFIDEIYWDVRRNMVVIRDGKAPKDLSNLTGSLDDLMDSQLQLYVWGIAPELEKRGYPTPRAVEFDRTRSVAPKQPQMTATGSLSKAVTAYDLKTYLDWARVDTRPSPEEIEEVVGTLKASGKLTPEQEAQIEDLPAGRFWGTLGEYFVSGAKRGQPKFGVYEVDPKVVADLSAPPEAQKWTERALTPVNARIVQAHLRSAVDTALDIYQTQRRAEVTGEAARNIDRRGCAWCDFRDLCRAEMVGGSAGAYDYAEFGLQQKPLKTLKTTKKTNEKEDN